MRSLCRPRAAEEAGRRRPGSVAQSGGSRPSPAHLGKEQVGGAALTPPQHPAVTATEGQHSPHSPPDTSRRAGNSHAPSQAGELNLGSFEEPSG